MMTVRRRKPVMARRKRAGRVRPGPKKVLAAAAVSMLLAGLAWAVFFTGIFEIREIRLHGGRSLAMTSLGESASDYVGSNIFTVPLTEIRRRLMADPAVGMVSFRRRPPHRLDCYLRERRPVALVSCGSMFEVDAEGFVIPSAENAIDIDLPLITGLDAGDLEEEVAGEGLVRALDVLGLLKEYGFSPAEQLSEIHLEDEEVTLVWMDTGSLIRIGSEAFEDRVRKFRAVYPALTDGGSLPASIDLRFDKQVVVR